MRYAQPHIIVIIGWLFFCASAAWADGVCCLPGACVDVANEAQCGDLGGVFLAGQVCADAPCGTGACCWEGGCNQTDAFSCITAGRDYAGAGTQCVDDPCELGFGGCCIGETCMEISKVQCEALGGVFLGSGVLCFEQPCTIAACCLGDNCETLANYECQEKGGVFLPDAQCGDENPCVPPSNCPDDSLFELSHDGPDDDFLAFTSEQSAGFKRFQLFNNVGGAIDALTWWGLELTFDGQTFSACTEDDPSFNIAFHEDAGGVPGEVVCSYTLQANRESTGISFDIAELQAYSVTLPKPCVLTNGWVSIEGLGDPECWFLWMSAGMGGSYCGGCMSPFEDLNLSICLQGEVGGIFGACCDDLTGECNEDVEINQCAAPTQRFVPDGSCDDLDPECGVILGACCFSDATCTIVQENECQKAGGDWLGANSICESCPCIVPCPDNAVDEGEVVCFDGYEDTFNPGCFSETPAFASIEAGQIVCGTSGIYNLDGENVPDTDWYEITVDEATTLNWTVQAEFPAQAFIADGNTPCPAEALADGVGLECDVIALSADVEPGTYWLIVFANAFTDTAFCGAGYTATVELGEPCPADIAGDDNAINVQDLLLLLSNWSTDGAGADLAQPNDVVDVADLLALLGAWGACP